MWATSSFFRHQLATVVILQCLLQSQSFTLMHDLPPNGEGRRSRSEFAHRRQAHQILSAASRDVDAIDDNAENGRNGASPSALTRGNRRIYIDIAIGDEDSQLGRLVFHLPSPNLLPLHADNVARLCARSQASIDPRCTYVRSSFRHSPQFIYGYPQYRWAHVLDGKGVNAVVGGDRIDEKEALKMCRNEIFGSGSYYGYNYNDIFTRASTVDSVVGDSAGVPPAGGGEGTAAGVVLAVPLSGPGRGLTALSIVRVGESPKEWGERLLINSAVIGWMNDGCINVLHQMAAQIDGPPTVVDSGILDQ